MVSTHSRTRFAFIALISTLAIGSAAVVKENSFSLKRVYREGDVDKYRTVILMESDNPTGTMTLEFTVLTTESVKEVRPDGGAVVETKVDTASLMVKDRINTATSELNDNTAILTTYDSTGKETKRAVTSDTGQSGPALMMVGLARAAIIPNRSMKAGEEWKYEIPAPDAKSARRSGTVSVVGLEKRTDTPPSESLKLKCTTVITTPGANGEETVNLVSTIALDPANGKPLEIEATGSGKLGPLNAKKITIKQARVKPGVKPDVKQ
jgi:hypothetical protein